MSNKSNEEEYEDQPTDQFVDMNTSKFLISDICLDERITTLGKTGSGKSWHVCYLTHKFSNKVPVVILDPKHEYINVPECPDRILSAECPKNELGVYKITELNYKGRKITNFRVIAEFLALNAFNRGDICCVFEEVGEYVPKNGRLFDTMPNFAKLLVQGRKRNCSMICVSQRPQDMHTSILSQSEHVFAFKQASPHDLDAVKRYFNPDWFKALRPYQYLHYNVKESKVKRKFGLFTKDQIYGLRMLGNDKKEQLQ